MDRRPEAAGPPPHADLATQGPSIVLVRKQVAPVESPPKSSFRRRPESRGAGWHQSHPNTSNNQASFSYLGLPAPAGTSDWDENSYPLAPNSLFSRKRESSGGVCTAPVTANTSTAQRPKFSYPGVPARAIAMKACPLTTIRDRPLRQHLIRHSRYPFVIPAPRFVIPAKAGIQRGGVAPTTPKHFQRPSLVFIPWCAGASPRHERLGHESMSRTPLSGMNGSRHRIRHSGESRNPVALVICMLRIPHKWAKLWGVGEGRVDRHWAGRAEARSRRAGVGHPSPQYRDLRTDTGA